MASVQRVVKGLNIWVVLYAYILYLSSSFVELQKAYTGHMKFGDPKPLTPFDRSDHGHESSSEAARQKAEGLSTERERAIVEFLTENLPESEERIRAAMDINCKVAVVIPAYCERHSILRMIKSLAEQKDVTVNEYELIVVVNNPDSPPKRASNEKLEDFTRRFDQFYKAVDENQQTLKLISYIHGRDVDVEMSEYERLVIETIRLSGLRVHAIDKASSGKTLSRNVANTGGARNRGVAEAVERFFKQRRNGIIAQTDADCSVDEKYISNLIKTFDTKPDLIGISGGMDMQVELGNEMLKLVSLYDEVKEAYQRLLNDLSIEADNSFADNNIFDRVHFFWSKYGQPCF